MAKHVYIQDFKDHVDEEVQICGWLYNRRSKGKLIFPILRDGTGWVQGVMFKGDFEEDTFKEWDTLPYESAVKVIGKVVADERAPGGFEMQIKQVEVVNRSEEYPISLQAHGPDFLLSNRHLWLRSKRQWAQMRIRHTIVQAIHEFFDSNDFIEFHTPILTPNACEGTTTLFELDYFDEGKAYLSQSGQLYGEAGAMALANVYVFNPCFRAEKSKTRKHLTEFWMIEPEMAYARLDDVVQLAEDLLAHIVAKVLEKRLPELDVMERDISKLQAIQKPFPRMTYTEAVEKMKELGHDFKWGDDFGSPDEDVITTGFDKPVMITHWPKDIKAFYMATDENNPEIALGVDVLAPEGFGEIIGGGERSTDLEYLRTQIEKHGLNEEDFKWYLDLRRYGAVPHGGFGLGLERTVAWICGTEHIRETIPFPRTIYRIYP